MTYHLLVFGDLQVVRLVLLVDVGLLHLGRGDIESDVGLNNFGFFDGKLRMKLEVEGSLVSGRHLRELFRVRHDGPHVRQEDDGGLGARRLAACFLTPEREDIVNDPFFG